MIAKAGKSNGNQSNRGGKRAGSGRKPKAVTEINQALISALAEESEDSEQVKVNAAVYAFRLFSKTMRDEEEELETRLGCAETIMNRVWGKPRQSVEVSGPDKEPLRIVVEYVDGNGNDYLSHAQGQIAEAASRPAAGAAGDAAV